MWKKIRSEKKFRRRLIRSSIYLICGGLIAGSVLFVTVALTLPDPNKINARIIPQSTKIYARDGTTLLYEIHGEAKRTLVELDQIPDHVKQATIAIEDRNFYNNQGFDWRGIARAVFGVFTSGTLQGPGGSTITQQFVRNAILTREKTLTRKIKEIILAIQINQKFTKDEILKLYLNEIPYGQNAYGIEAAAQTYFGKSAADLTLAEAAYLAALPQAPTFYSPNGPNLDRLTARQKQVLKAMEEEGYITAQQRTGAEQALVTFQKIKTAIKAPHFVLYVQSLLAESYGEKALEEGGLRVITTLDAELQQLAETAIADAAERNLGRYGANNASLVALDPKTGQVLAMVGSRDFFNEDIDGQVNVSVRPLQPGSSIKPYVYATAFKQGMSPATMLIDVPTVFGKVGDQDYRPGNYDGSSHGIVNIRQALAGSLNVPAVKTLALVGIQNAIDTMKDLGITADLNTDVCGLSLVLGGCEISLLDHTSAMGVLANDGIRHRPTSILEIIDSDGEILEKFEIPSGEEVLDPQIAYLVTDIMSDNDARTFIFGPNSSLVLPGRPVAAKTGTTQAWKDGWTMGFTPSLVAGVWVGNTNGSVMRQGADGSVVAAPIWNQFMREALRDVPPESFLTPAGITTVMVDSISGKLPTDVTPVAVPAMFADFAIPQDFDDVHVAMEINRLNGQRATPQTPADLKETRAYTVIHSERPDDPDWETPVRAWAEQNGFILPPTELDDGGGGSVNLNKDVKFITPINQQEVTRSFQVQVDVSPNAVTEVELILEGELVGKKRSAPYNFSVEALDPGWQTLLARVRFKDGVVVDQIIRINALE